MWNTCVFDSLANERKAYLGPGCVRGCRRRRHKYRGRKERESIRENMDKRDIEGSTGVGMELQKVGTRERRDES